MSLCWYKCSVWQYWLWHARKLPTPRTPCVIRLMGAWNAGRRILITPEDNFTRFDSKTLFCGVHEKETNKNRDMYITRARGEPITAVASSGLNAYSWRGRVIEFLKFYDLVDDNSVWEQAFGLIASVTEPHSFESWSHQRETTSNRFEVTSLRQSIKK